MNLFGNSLKFTSVNSFQQYPRFKLNVAQDGYVHVMLRQYPLGPGEVKVELSVIDTGKVSRDSSHLDVFMEQSYCLGHQ
jgi:signal transduction histidine kinase